jgi:hypothetical protein
MTRTKTITLRNDFHCTECNVRVRFSKSGRGELTERQVKRARNVLCCDECSCGGPLGERGPQDVDVIPTNFRGIRGVELWLSD